MVKKIAVTGSSGQIAYSLLFRIASGELFGSEPIFLSLYDLPSMQQAVEGVVMEMEDCSFPLLQGLKISSDPSVAFEDADCVFLVGAKPRGSGMERSQLLEENGQIFVREGRALNESASGNAKILVVGNPCNTNCLIAMHHAPRIPKKNFHAMMRLDQNRAQGLLAKEAQVPVTAVTQLVVWGNHSSTQVPDFLNAKINGNPIRESIKNENWLKEAFLSSVQKRGASIIAARGKSSAASAAQAALDAMRALYQPTPMGQFFSSAVSSDENPYGIEEGLVFGFPCRCNEKGEYEIVPNLEWDFFLREKIAITQKELIEERRMVERLLVK